MNDSEKLALLYESITLTRQSEKIVNGKDISNLLTELISGNEKCTIYGRRYQDSRTEPHKRAGMKMVINGRFGVCSKLPKSDRKVPELSSKRQYDKNALIRVCADSVDGESYTRRKPEDKMTSIKVGTIYKIEAGNETYHIR